MTRSQHIIEKYKRREYFVKEIRNINAAISAGFSTAGITLSLKEQHSLPLFEKFHSDLEALEIFTERNELNQLRDGEVFQFDADFKTFLAPSIPIETLKDILFNKVSSSARILCALSSLEGSYISLSDALKKREIIVEKFKDKVSEDEFRYYYFGLTMPSGHTNQEYSDIIEAIHRCTDDVIFFSSLICKDLMALGKEMCEKEKKLSKHSPKIREVDFCIADESGLMPLESDFKNWLDGFRDK